MREVAYPQMARLARTIIWPMNLLTPAGETMLVRESTHHLSPVSIHRSMIGTRWPYMVTSFGRAYLAYCTDQERSELLRLLVGSSLPGNRLAGNPRSVATLIERTRRDGYGSTLEEVVEGFSSIAVPIHVAGRTVGCLNTIFFTSVFTPAKAAEKFLAPLKETVSIIQEEAQQYVD
jgi:IclR family mhp operon transcriptional activator